MFKIILGWFYKNNFEYLLKNIINELFSLSIQMKIKFVTYIIILLSIVSFISAQPRERKMYVMCVGVGDYADPRIHDLTKPTCDADTVASMFAKGDNEVMVLKDSMATGDNVRQQMKAFFSKATQNDVIMFFFSGHGIKSGFCAHDYFQSYTGALWYDDIKKIFNGIKVHGKIIMADACFSGKLRSKRDTITAQPLRLAGKQQVMLFLSSRGEEVSYESPSMTNGYFTTYLVEGLRGAADVNGNGKVTAIELSNYVASKLKMALGNHQHSVMWGNFSKGWILSKVTRQTDNAKERDW